MPSNSAEPDQSGNACSRRPTRDRWALVSLSLCTLMPSLDTSIANAGLPTLAAAFAASFQSAQWIVLAYLLAITTLIVSMGRLGDFLGRRRLLLAGIALFTAASLLCAVAPTLLLLVAARAVQGLGAAVMMALTVAFVGEVVPTQRIGRAMGLLGTMSAIGTTLGPSLGGVLIHGFGWRTIFLVNVPLGLLIWQLARRTLPEGTRAVATARTGFDLLGTVLLAASLSAYALAMTLGRGHFGSLNVALILTALSGAALFVLAEKKSESPLVRLSAFRDSALSGGLALSMLVTTVMMTTLVVGPFYLARALGLGPVRVGFVLAIGPLVSALTGIPAGRLVDWLGARRMTLIGLAGIASGSSILSFLPMKTGILGYVTPIALMTASYALFQAANNTALMTGVTADHRGVVAGMLSLSRNLGLITGASLMGAVFALASRTTTTTLAPPDAVATGMHVTLAVAALLMMVGLLIATASHARARPASSELPEGEPSRCVA